jgi:hydrogenase maturation protein HypF
VRQIVTYEAQAAVELEALVNDGCESYRFNLPTASAITFDARPVLHAVVDDLRAGVPPATIASRFHNAVANLIFELSLTLRGETGLNQVALTGGVFQNKYLLEQAVRRLRAAKFEVLTHRQVPPNDGGLALGQAMVAASKEC